MKNVISVTKVVVSLHNYLINETRYISRPMEEGMGEDQNLQESFLSSDKLAGITELRGHSKSTFVVQRGRGGSLKSKLKRIGEGGVKPICTLAL